MTGLFGFSFAEVGVILVVLAIVIAGVVAVVKASSR
jgi:hypothetical protein